MAAGLGSRFGSLKQLQPIYQQYAIIDYSIYDGISVGFNNIVFIVREEILNQFKARYEHSFFKDISVEFVIQNVNNVPEGIFSERTKPWGTGHALLILKEIVKNPFALINADDFYGRTSFKLMHDSLYESQSNNNYFIGYPICKTLSETGYVSRGECNIDKNKYLNKITERTQIGKSKDGNISYLNENMEEVKLPPNTISSMNFWGFTPGVFSVAEVLFAKFLKHYSKDDISEFYLPSIVDYSIKKKIKSYKMLLTNEQWYGITYKEDEKIISDKIKEFIKKGLYPENLW